jgi:hypothetical protein
MSASGNGSQFSEFKGGESVLPKELPSTVTGGTLTNNMKSTQVGGKRRKSKSKSRKSHRKTEKKSIGKKIKGTMKKMLGKLWK